MTTLLRHAPSTHFRSTGDLTAATPPEERAGGRDAVRLLVAEGTPAGPTVTHTGFDRIGDHLHPGDVLVVNTSATCAREVDAELERRGPVVLHVATALDESTAVVELRTSPDASAPLLDAAVGDVVEVDLAPRGTDASTQPASTVLRAGLRLEAPYPEDGSSPTGEGNRLWRAAVLATDASGTDDPSAAHDVGELLAGLDRVGRPIAYGYLAHRYPLAAYQTVFARVPGSAEMASAGRPFTADLVTRLVTAGVLVAPVLLHTGVSSQEAGEAPQPEWFCVPDATAALVDHARSRGGRVVAVGTTATRALESATDASGTVHAAEGWTDLVIGPDRPVRVVGGLVTGWHDPEASHLLLVESVAGPALTQAAYDEALAHRYGWHEFGDAGLFLPARRP
ncbi:S-adenosylmethionine:tRNA ribosyltransferase-isomerase [Intrasporangium sp. YIM S08009]|uniref:S-adenosylmethionine:tRNA ribosyltransferase-isomerase n=1 Tax=Intrasporangium zincisolvens TaxID=3080018 RepID=UPI002B05EBCD|nr:S-adenosylmethionine:tRNA ribosyltransferase-isomerase [Intrasporangium sp. YIM S08009]